MITILKLVNGTELICDMKKETSESFVVEKPLMINYRYYFGSTPSVSFVRYIMFADNDIVTFARKDIMHEVSPREAFANYYKSVVEYYYGELEQAIDKELDSVTSPSKTTSQEQHMKKILEMMPIDDTPMN